MDVVVRELFGRLKSSWYAPHQIHLKQNISERYRQRFFNKPNIVSASEAQFALDSKTYFGAIASSRGYRIGAIEFPSPAETLFGPAGRTSYYSCLQHGDLNSDNVLLGCDEQHIWLVDFDHCGPGHAFEDLVSTEASIRINMEPHSSYHDIQETERRIAMGYPTDPADVYASAIASVRRAALQLFHQRDAVLQYTYSVAAIGLRLMQAVDLQDFARARIVASTLWATKLLAKADGT